MPVQQFENCDLDNYIGFLVIPMFENIENLDQIVNLIFKSIPDGFGLLIVDIDSKKFRKIGQSIKLLDNSSRDIFLMKISNETHRVKIINLIFKNLLGKDLIFYNNRLLPSDDCFQKLSEAAKSSTLVASASVTYNSQLHGLKRIDSSKKVCNDPRRLIHLEKSPQYPIILSAFKTLIFFNAFALNVVGLLNEQFKSIECAIADWCQRAISFGLRNIHCDRTNLISPDDHDTSMSKLDPYQLLPISDRKKISQLNPEYERLSQLWFSDYFSSIQFEDNINESSDLSNLIRFDLTGLAPPFTGTARVAFEMAKHLVRYVGYENLDFIVKDPFSIEFFEKYLGKSAKIFTLSDLDSITEADVVFRPMQIGKVEELISLLKMGKRQVVHQLDFIAYENYSYFDSIDAWLNYRNAVELTFSTVSAVTYLTNFVQEESTKLGLDKLSHSRLSAVVGCGSNHIIPSVAKLSENDELIFQKINPTKNDLIIYGTNYIHKNRLYGLKLLQKLHEIDSNSETRLILAGAKPHIGNSEILESEFLSNYPNLAEKVIQINWVSDELLNKLIKNVGLVLYPSVSEGFGLVPFEAIVMGTPTLASDTSSLKEILNLVTEKLSLDDIGKDVQLLHRLLTDLSSQEKLKKEIIHASSKHTWEKVNSDLVKFLTAVRSLHVKKKVSVHTLEKKYETRVFGSHQFLGNAFINAKKLRHSESNCSKLFRITKKCLNFLKIYVRNNCQRHLTEFNEK